MLLNCLLALFGASALTAADETILGVYIFSRHGDRTAKSTPPANLTDLGYQQVLDSGTYYRNRFVAANAATRIAGLNTDVVRLSQLAVSAPLDNVLMSSATGFMQGLYPPVSGNASAQTLRNGTVQPGPLSGYQIIPIQQTTSGAGSEDSAWLQGSSNCANALISSNNYLVSNEYLNELNATQSFYNGLTPMINATFTAKQTSFQNAYTIFDLLNVASIHNQTFPASNLLTPDTFFQLQTLADTHEFNSAYNASDPIRAVAGATLAAQIVQGLNTTIASAGKTKVTVQFGAYGSFQSFFGLANLTGVEPSFYGIPVYASSMLFELYTEASPSPFPQAADLRVRFSFANGTATSSSPPTPYPLFGGNAINLTWSDFSNGMNKFAIGDQQSWCTACGNSTGVCAGHDTAASANGGSGSGSTSGSDSSNSNNNGSSSGSSISLPVAGVIGAMVTLGVIALVEALVFLIFGLRIVRKGKSAAGSGAQAGKAQ